MFIMNADIRLELGIEAMQELSEAIEAESFTGFSQLAEYIATLLIDEHTVIDRFYNNMDAKVMLAQQLITYSDMISRIFPQTYDDEFRKRMNDYGKEDRIH
mgnify:FL=1